MDQDALRGVVTRPLEYKVLIINGSLCVSCDLGQRVPCRSPRQERGHELAWWRKVYRELPDRFAGKVVGQHRRGSRRRIASCGKALQAKESPDPTSSMTLSP